MLDSTPNSRALAFLGRFEAALAAGDAEAASNLFAIESYWRDLVAFTWNFKTLEGRDAIKDMLRACLPAIRPRKFALAEGETVTETDGVTEAWFTFETEVGARLRHAAAEGRGRSWTLLTTLAELKGHEERQGFTRPLGATHGINPGAKPGRSGARTKPRRSATACSPMCLIIGGGQGAIGLGARLRQLDVPTIIVEKNERPGDSWRKRYKSLCLHDPVWYDHLPYLDFPKNWPVFSPKDKIGDWLEMYAKVMELNYWGSTDRQARELRRGQDKNGPSPSSGTAGDHAAAASNSCSPPACRPSRTCRSSRAWRRSRASSTIPRSIPAPTPARASASSSSAPTIPRTTSARRYGRTTST